METETDTQEETEKGGRRERETEIQRRGQTGKMTARKTFRIMTDRV